HSVCFGLFHPAAVVFISERVPKRLLAVGLTIYTSVAVSMSSVIGNVAGGFIIDRWGYRVLFVFFSVFPLLGVLFFMLMRTRKQGTH
ncbi:MAG TPA: MFS transporter, partial [Treponemataceae bacterium]|nr:MFS transporter [Treponemataceae bacterium]